MATVRKRTWLWEGQKGTAWIADYFDQGGVRRQKTFRKKAAATEWLNRTAVDVKNGIHTPDSASITIAEAAARWLDHCERDQLERSTIRQRQQHIDLHIRPFIGDVKLSKLTAPMVQEFVDRLRDEGRSPAMVQKILTNLKTLISVAQARGLVAQNVAREVKLRRSSRDRKEATIPSKGELAAMLNGATGRWRPLIMTAIFTGLRASELRGLTWENVDFEAKVIRVRQRADRWNQIGSPKSRAGRRDVPIGPELLKTLKEWGLACPPGALNLVFPNGQGNVENHANIYHRGLGALLKAVGILDRDGKPKYTLHELRHAAASLFIAQHLPAKKVQTLMGHSSIAMTFDLYGHLFPDAENDQAAVAQIEAGVLR